MYLMTSVSHFTKGGGSVVRPLWLLLYQRSSRMELKTNIFGLYHHSKTMLFGFYHHSLLEKLPKFPNP